MYYRGIGPEEGHIVEGNQAYDYALERCLKGTLDEQQEFRDMLVDWYYSGNWVKEHNLKLRKQHNYEIEEGLRDESLRD